MSTNVAKHYLVTNNCANRKIGTILCIDDKIAIDFDKGVTCVFKTNELGSLIQIPEDKVQYIFKFKNHERIYALKVILKQNNLYHPKSANNILQKICPTIEIKYYLIPDIYCAWENGSLFAMNNKTIYDFDIMNGAVINEAIPRNWIQITEADKETLKGKKRNTRLNYYNQHLKKGLDTYPTSKISVTESKTSIEVPKLVTGSLPKPIDLPSELEYFESTVIIPSSVVDVKNVYLVRWTVGEEVTFTLLESGSRYEGTLKWVGTINGINAAAVYLAHSMVYDPLLLYRCSQALTSRLNIDCLTRVVLVRLSTVNKSMAKYDLMTTYFTRMYGSLNDSNLASQIFNDAERLNNPIFLTSLVSNCPISFLSDLCLKLISIPRNDVIQISNLIGLINKIPTSENGNLLKLLKLALMLKNESLISTIKGKITDFNMHLNSGETVLTDIIKSNADEQTINGVIRTKFFDINKPNTMKETPLTLVCGRFLVKSVRLLVELNCNVNFDNNKAMSVLFASKKAALNKDQMKRVIEIIEVLNSANKQEINICTICMDRKINIVFNCGHNSCKDCAEKLVVCHFCKKTISNRIPLFLD